MQRSLRAARIAVTRTASEHVALSVRFRSSPDGCRVAARASSERARRLAVLAWSAREWRWPSCEPVSGGEADHRLRVDGAMAESRSDAAPGRAGAGVPVAAGALGGAEASIDPNVLYALGASSHESARLHRQSDELASESWDLLDRAGVRPGDSAIDVGCGPRGIIELLCERVSPGGRVVGLDADPAHVAMASEFVASRGLVDVQIVCADARHTGLHPESFDLVHARALLVNIPEPHEVVEEMVRLTRPGGFVAGLEPDNEIAICYPPHPAVERLCELFLVALSRTGADVRIGRRVAHLYREAGLEGVMVEARADVYPPGHSRRTFRADLVRGVRPQILELGLANERELDELDTAAREHLGDPETLVLPHLVFLTWGRKPGRA